MAKRIIVCSDGTGNTAIKGRGTNVFKLFEAVDLVGHRSNPALKPQVAVYDDGVGTEKFKPVKLFSGAFGWGLSRNVKHLYRELARIYDPGDEIYMFGFSRGAFTVRTLAGFISTCGLVDPGKVDPKDFSGLNSAVNRAYKAYRKCYRPALWRVFSKPTRSAGQDFKAHHSFCQDVKVQFVGVWDTVDAVGLPFHLGAIINAVFYQFKFPDHGLSSIVQHARQALSIDDARQTFSPQLWTEDPSDAKRIKQVWFPGVHSNVGGGYPKQGLSMVTLDWMLGEAEKVGLRVNPDERRYFRDHANSDDKLYDPRAGLGIFYRWKIRDIAALCSEYKVTPLIHVTALERIAHGTDNYAPGNLPSHASVVISSAPPEQDIELEKMRAEMLQCVLASSRVTPLDTVRLPVATGIASYYIYVLSVAAVLIALVSGSQLVLWPWPFAGFVLSYAWMFLADRRMDAVFSGFWYGRQTKLRDALKQAREAATSLGSAFPETLVTKVAAINRA
jgi:uncharacterized protein (DUF2235 family)